MKNNRNKQIVGNNSASYNDKHPENPIQLHPIGSACRLTKINKWKRAIRKLSNMPRNELNIALNDTLKCMGLK